MLLILHNLDFAGGDGEDAPEGLEDNGTYKKRPIFLVSAVGRTRWVHYWPIKQFPLTTSAQADRYDDDGALTVDILASNSGLTEWVDYIPCVEVADPDTGKWRTNDTGFLPVVAVV
jgi:hypothetical protein